MISHLLFNIQESLFPHLEVCLGSLTSKERKLIEILEIASLDGLIPEDANSFGRPASSRINLARAFIAKAVLNIPNTSALLERLHSSVNLRTICGYGEDHHIPSESTFSRAFAEFVDYQLPEKVHALMIERFQKKKLVGHISRDSTAVIGREKAVKPKEKEVQKEKRKPGRPKKGEEVVKEPTFLEKQHAMTVEEIMEQLPDHCNHGVKKNSKGFKTKWRGYKLHLDVTDAHVPVSCLLTSASLHDSQAAIALAKMTNTRVEHCYELMDAAYDAKPIKDFIESNQHIPLIDSNPRRNGVSEEMCPATKKRYGERSSVERVNARLKEEFGVNNVMVRGAKKVMTHIMFSIIVLTADQLIRMVT